MKFNFILSILFLTITFPAIACNVTISATASAICLGDTITLSATGSSTYQWLPGSSTAISITVSPTITTTYTVIGTDGSGCIDTTSITITVNLLPVITIAASNDTICVGALSSLSANGATTYLWMPGNATGQNINVAPPNTTTYTVTGISSITGCSNTVVKTIHVKANPKPILLDSNIFYPFSNCSNTTGLPLYHLNVSTPFQANINSYSINWGDGSGTTAGIGYTSFPLTHNYSNYGVYSLVFTANYSNGCNRDTSILVINQTNPAIGIQNQFGGNTQGCAPVEFCFKMTNYSSNSPGTIYLWNFGDGTTVLWNNSLIDSICHTYTTSSCGLMGNQFEVSVTAINSCDSTKASINNIKIFTKPTASFTPVNNSGCINTPFSFVNNSTYAQNSPNCNQISTFNWDFGDPLSGASNTINTTLLTTVSHTYTNPGYYTVRLIASGSCGSDTMEQIVCIENPISTYSVSSVTNCAPSIFSFTNTSPSLTVCGLGTFTWSVVQLSSSCTPDSMADYTFISGTSASSINPMIRINNEGNYRIRLTHNSVCGIYIKDTILIIKRKPLLNITSPNDICTYDTLHPTASVTNCGTTPMNFLWSSTTASSGSPSTISNPSFNFPSGTHTLNLQVSNECGTTNMSSIINVHEPPNIVLTSIPSSSICLGQSITLIATGANLYTWLWPGGGAAGNSITLNPIGTTNYTVTGTDLNGCSQTQSITNVVHPTPSLSVTAGILSCIPGNDASITITGSGGVSGYQYGLNGSYQASNIFTGLSGGTYTVSIMDANNCSSSLIQNISAPNSPSISSSSFQNVSCHSGSNGSITVTGAGGTGPLSFILEPGAITNTTGVFINLVANNYTVVVKDAFGCTGSIIKVITQPVAPLSWVNATTNPVSCFGASTGSINTNIAGGTSPYIYTLQPTSTSNSSGVFTGNQAGTYTVTVTDMAGCSISTTLTITEPSILIWNNLFSSAPLCNGSATGSLSASISGGTGAILYSLLPGSVTSSTGSFVNLAAAAYTVQATDANGCTSTTLVSITQPPTLSISNITHLAPSCIPGGDGMLSFTGSGGTPGYQFGLNGAFQTASGFASLGAGIYTLSVKDTNGCIVSNTYNLTPPNAPVISSSSVLNVSCYSGNNGSISVSGAGGTGSLSYILEPGTITNTTGVFMNLVANNYTIIVKDALGCSGSIIKVITQPVAPLSWVNATANPVSCFGTSTGIINTNVVGGTSPYIYTLQPGALSNSSGYFTGRPLGSYTVTVSDANGCTAITTLLITQPLPLIWGTSTTSDVDCFGGANASININSSGGSSSITYTLLPGTTTNGSGTFIGLSAGLYTVMATDANGCSISSLLNISQPSALSISNMTHTSPSCVPGNDGSINLIGNGGSVPYQYSISPSYVYSFTNVFNNLGTSTYTVFIKDAHDCTASAIQSIMAPNAPVFLSISQTDESCVPGNDGTILANVINGAPPYEYAINPPSLLSFQSSNLFDSLSVGTFTLLVRDTMGCTNSTVIAISTRQPPVINSLSKTDASCSPGCDGSITITAAGIDLSYKINSGAYQLSPIFNSLCANTYTVTVKDGFGCTATTLLTIATVGSLNITVNSLQNVSCYGGNNGSIVLSASSGTGLISYSLFPGNITNSTGVYSSLSEGNYTVTATDANGCTKSTTLMVSQPSLLIWGTITSNDVSCHGGSNATISSLASGGSGLINYTLLPTSNTNTTGLFNGLGAMAYTLSAIDANGCSISNLISITQPLALVIDSISQSAPSCLPGSLTVFASGGSLPYLYSNNGVSYSMSGFFTGLSTGIYTLTVKDNNSCTATYVHTMTSANTPYFTNLTITNASCYGSNNGSISNISANGGVGPYMYSILPTGTFSNLAPNSYTVVVTDMNSCTSSTTLTITEPAPISPVGLIITDVTCHNFQDGNIHISCIGGTGTLHYNLLPVNVSNLSGVFSGLDSTTYTLVVSDDSNCTYTTTATVLNPPPLIFTSVSSTPISCNGNSNASIVVLSNGGTGSHSYSINPSLSPNNTTGVFNFLPANTYTVSVMDSSNCSRDTMVAISQPPPITGSFIVQQNVSCFGGNNGAFTIFTNTGWSPFQYYLLGTTMSNSSGIFNNIQAGTYSVQIVDSAFCSIVVSPITVTQPNPMLWDSVIHANVLCFGDNTGTIDAHLDSLSGTPPIHYDLIPIGVSSATGVFSGLAAGTYTIIATDALNCTAVTLVTINQQPGIVFDNISIKNPLCNGDQNGNIVANVSGTVPLTYQLNGLIGGPAFNNLPQGQFTLQVTDANGCISDTVLILNEPEVLLPDSLIVSPVPCLELDGGKIIIRAKGGTQPYSYFLNGNSGPGEFNGLSIGTYTLTIRDSSMLCIFDTTIDIKAPLHPLSISITKNDLNCLGFGNEGWATANVFGGWPPYNYYWPRIEQYTKTATDLYFGTYIVFVTDSNNCKISDTVYIEPGSCCENVFIPNAFSPNGDGLNDEFKITTTAAIEMNYFKVYNRWGNPVWNAPDFRSGWDGMTGSGINDNSTFYYILQYKCLTDNKTYIKKGDVTIIR